MFSDLSQQVFPFDEVQYFVNILFRKSVPNNFRNVDFRDMLSFFGK